MKKFIMFLAFVFALSFVSGCGQKDSADSIFDKMIEAYGGLENLKKLDSYISVWQMEVRVRPAKGKVVNFMFSCWKAM